MNETLYNAGTTPQECRAIRRAWINYMLQSSFPWTLTEIKTAVRFYELR